MSYSMQALLSIVTFGGLGLVLRYLLNRPPRRRP